MCLVCNYIGDHYDPRAELKIVAETTAKADCDDSNK